MVDTREILRSYLTSHIVEGKEADRLQDETPLMTGGILDSVSILQLIAFVEERFEIEIQPHEASVRNFDNIEGIAKLIESKR